MDNIPGELLDETARHHAHANPSALADLLRVVAGHHVVRADKLRSQRTRGWKGASDELDTVARHITEYADALTAHAELYPVGTTFTPSPEPIDPAALPGNTGRCAAFRRATPDDETVCSLPRGHSGDHASTADGVGIEYTWPRKHSGQVCGDVVVIYDGSAINCALPLGHDGDEHYDGRYRLWPRGVGTLRNVRVCDYCNQDRHNCPGCGQPVGHFTVACATCAGTPAPVFGVVDDERGPDGVRVIKDVRLHSVSLVSDPLPGQEIISVTPVPDEPGTVPPCHDRQRDDDGNHHEDATVCMLPTGHTGKHIGYTGDRWEQVAAEPSTLAEQTDAARAAMAPSIPEQRQPEADTPAAVLVAETKEQVSATVAELTNPFAAFVQRESDGAAVYNGAMAAPEMAHALTNPFAATPPAPPAAPVAELLPPHLVPGAPKAYQSVSSILTMSECALRYRLQYRDGLSQRRPAWWNVGGTAFHSTVQHIERMHAESGGALYPITEPVFQTERDAAAVWAEKFDAQVALVESDTDSSPAHWQAAKGGKEGRAWWQSSGEDMVRRYVHHRREFLTGWRLLTTPAGGFAQEVEFNAVIGGVPMKGFIDSAWISTDGTTIRVEDYKSGSSAGDPFQLRTYGAALRAMGADSTEQGGARRIVGTFYEARKGAATAPLALTAADDAEVSYRANTAAAMDRAGIFPANPGRNYSNCSTCDVAASCPIMAMKG